MAKAREYNGHLYEDNGHGDLYNAETDKFLIFRPYPLLVDTVMHKDESVTMNQKKFKENTDKNKGVYEEGYEVNDDGSVYVKAVDVDDKIAEESENNKSTVDNYSQMSQEELDDVARNEMSDKEFEEYQKTTPSEEGSIAAGKLNSYFTLESPLGDMEAAQQYLDADDMKQYLDEDIKPKVDSIRWVLDDDQSGHVEIETNSPLTKEEQDKLQDWIDGQNSDGLGEGFEQQDFANAYYNPDTGDGPYTYQEAEQEIADMIDSADISDIIDYVDESEIEAAVDTYMEDNDLYNKFIEEHQDEAYDDILVFVDPSEVEGAFLDIRGDDSDDAEMLAKDPDSLYDIINSDESLKEEIGNYLLQNLPSYELTDFVAGMEGGDDFREQCKEDMLNDDPEGYLSDDAIYQAKEDYANDNYNTNIDEWGSMASIRRSVDGLQLETPKEMTAQEASQNQINRLNEYEDAYDAYDKAMEKANTNDYKIQSQEFVKNNNIDTSTDEYTKSLNDYMTSHGELGGKQGNFLVYNSDENDFYKAKLEHDKQYINNEKFHQMLDLRQDVGDAWERNESGDKEYEKFSKFLDENPDVAHRYYSQDTSNLDSSRRGVEDYIKTVNDNKNSNSRVSRNQGLYDNIKVDKSNDAIKILQGTSNGSIDLEDNYEIRKYDDGTIQISSSHPYDLSDYSFAKYADYNTSFSVYSPKGELVTVVNTVDDALDEMKKIDKKIKAKIDRT